MPPPKQPAPSTTNCGFQGPNGVLVDEATLRAAVAQAAVAERLLWFDKTKAVYTTEDDDARFGDLVRYWLAGLNGDIQPDDLRKLQQAATGGAFTYTNLANPTLNKAIQAFKVAEAAVNTMAADVYLASGVVDAARAVLDTAAETANAARTAVTAAAKRVEDAKRQSGSGAAALLAQERAALTVAKAERDTAVSALDAATKTHTRAAAALKTARGAHTAAKTKRKALQGPVENWDTKDRDKVRKDLLAQAGNPKKIDTIVGEGLQAAHNSRGDTEAWSSAFIGATIRAAAINLQLEVMSGGKHEGKNGILVASRRHSDYIAAALKGKAGTYQAFKPRDHAIQKGDIIVTDRGDFITRPATLSVAGVAGQLLHGDIVCGVGSVGGTPFAETIGGNVRHTVRRRRYPLDADGKLLVSPERLYVTEENNGQFPAFSTVAPTTMLHVASTGRIFALLSPVCKDVTSGSGRELETLPLETPFMDNELLAIEPQYETVPDVDSLAAESPFSFSTLEEAIEELDVDPELEEELVIEEEDDAEFEEEISPDFESSEEDPPIVVSAACRPRLKNLRVAVVGGGLGGLMAARDLGRLGVKVTLFEARSQWGGRVLSNRTFSSDRIVEEGAELIGSFHTRWLALARHYGLSVVSRMDESHYERAGLDVKRTLDRPLTMKEVLLLGEELKTKVLEPIAKLARQIVDPSRPWRQETTLKAFDIPVAKALGEKPFNLDRKKDERLWMEVEYLLVNNEVAPLEEMSFLGLLCKVRAGQLARFITEDTPESHLMNYWNELEIFRCADGCQTMANKMAYEIKHRFGATLHGNTAVTRIKLTGKGVELETSPVLDRKGTLGKSRRADAPFHYVILAIPPTVWERVTITEQQGKAEKVIKPEVEVGVMGEGPAVKFFTDLKKRFWVGEKAAPYGGATKLGQIWEGTDNQTNTGQQGIVLGVFAGPIRTDAAGRRAPKPDEFKEELRKLYKHYDENVKKTLFSDWPNVPFIRTGYISPRPGQIFDIGRKLNNPFHGRLFFAGEHTRMDFFGYMEGALRSGRDAAVNVILQECGSEQRVAEIPDEEQELEDVDELEVVEPADETATHGYPEREDGLTIEEEEEELDSEEYALPERELPLEMAEALEEYDTPALPTGLHRFEHWIQPMKRDAATSSWIPDGGEVPLEPLDPGFLDASDALKTFPLGDALKTLLTTNTTFSRHLSRDAVRNGKASAADKLRVALVDLTGDKLLNPEYAGWGSTVAVDGASCPKVAALYAAFQLRNDLKHVAAAEKIATTADLIAFMTERWKQDGIDQPPRLKAAGSRPGLLHLPTDPPALEFTAEVSDAIDNVIDPHKANDAARVLIDVVGYPYIASLMWQSGLRHPTRGGMWLTSSYAGGAAWSRPVKPSPAPVFGHNVTALSLATFFTLLGQDRLTRSGLPRTIRTALSTASWFRDILPSASIASKVGLLKNHVHEAALIENGRFRYAVAILTKDISAGVSLLQTLIGELDGLIRQNNP